MAPLTSDLIRIANAGGGMVIDARGMLAADLVRIANASASRGTGIIKIKNSGSCLTNDLIRIANAGKGNVILILHNSNRQTFLKVLCLF